MEHILSQLQERKNYIYSLLPSEKKDAFILVGGTELESSPEHILYLIAGFAKRARINEIDYLTSLIENI